MIRGLRISTLTATCLLVALAGAAVAQDAKTSTRSARPAKVADEGDLIFVKGDLVEVGTRELLSRYDHGGIRVGPHILGKDFFLGVDPGFAYYDAEWAVSLHAPLNMLLLRGGTTEFGGMKLRRQDWDEASDFARVIRLLSYGRRESPLYFGITSIRPHSIGHGLLMQNYQSNIDIDRSYTGAVFEINRRFGGAQARIADVTFQNRVVGALAYLKPLGFIDGDILSSLSLGVEYAADFAAPRCVRTSEEGECLPGGPTAKYPNGNQAGPDPLTGASRDHTFMRTDSDFGRPFTEDIVVHAIGFSGEMRFMKTERSDMKLYGTYHKFFDHGAGIAGGVLGRFTTGESSVHAFRVRAEYRNFEADFATNYFDTLYEVTKYQFGRAQPRAQTTPTKYQAIFGDPENGYTLLDTERRHGFRLEASWAWFDETRSNKLLGVGLGISDSTAGDDTELFLHVEAPLLKYVQFFGTILRINSDGLGDVFAADTDNLVVLSGLRVQVLPILFINAHYSRSFQIIRGAGREFHLGNETIVDEAGQPSSFFSTDRVYENVDTLFVEIELGLEFKGDEDEELVEERGP